LVIPHQTTQNQMNTISLILIILNLKYSPNWFNYFFLVNIVILHFYSLIFSFISSFILPHQLNNTYLSSSLNLLIYLPQHLMSNYLSYFYLIIYSLYFISYFYSMIILFINFLKLSIIKEIIVIILLQMMYF
jgi:hypothetical protein